MKMLEFPFPFSLVTLNAEITPRKICRESHARCDAIVIFYCGKGGAHFFSYLDICFFNCNGWGNQFFFYHLDFLSQTFTIHRTAVEGGGYLFNSSPPI